MKRGYSLTLLFLFILACNSSKMTYSWKSDQTHPNSFQKIMVVALDNYSREVSTRIQMETHMVDDLNARGHLAVSATKEFGPKVFEGLTEKQALEKLKDNGADAVLTIVLLDKKRERYYVPGRVQYSPYIIYQRRFWGYYTTIYDRIYTPGYYMDDTRYFWESSLYDLKTMDLIYTAQTESFDPASVSRMGHEYGLLIVNDLLRNNVLRQVESTSSQ